MNKFILPLLLFLLLPYPLFAGKAAEVSLRYGRQENSIRIVLDSDEEFIQNANTSSSTTSVKIEFPGMFEFKKPADFMFEVAKKDRLLIIQLRDVSDIRTYKLSSPSRLVIDLRTIEKKAQETAQKPETRGQTENVQKGEQKPQPQGQKLMQKVPTESDRKTPPITPQKPLQAAPHQAETVRKPKVIVIDAGHGGYDFGLLDLDTREKDLTLSLAKELGAALSKNGLTSFLTRRTDQLVPLSERITFANSKNPDIFISIHASSSEKCSLYTSTYEEMNVDAAVKLYSLLSRQGRSADKSTSLANALAESLKSGTGCEVLIRELPLPVLNSMGSPAVMVEFPGMKAYASDQKLREKFVSSILKGMTAYEQ